MIPRLSTIRGDAAAHALGTRPLLAGPALALLALVYALTAACRRARR